MPGKLVGAGVNVTGWSEPRSGSRHRSGFALVEVLAAMVILAVGMMGLRALGIGATRVLFEADRRTGYATQVSDSMEAALYELRRGVAPREFCFFDSPHGERISRTIDMTDSLLAVVTVRVAPDTRASGTPEGFELVSSVFLPVRVQGEETGGSCG